MIEVKDRIPTKPNRIRIVPENGAPFYAAWERADEPIEEGTPVNKYLFDSIDEGGHFSNALDDIEMDAQRVTLTAGWTTVLFQRPLSGVPRVFVPFPIPPWWRSRISPEPPVRSPCGSALCRRSMFRLATAARQVPRSRSCHIRSFRP